MDPRLESPLYKSFTVAYLKEAVSKEEGEKFVAAFKEVGAVIELK